MTILNRMTALALATALAFTVFTPAAMAQKAPEAAAKPAAKAAKKAAKAPSPCKGLEEAQCGTMKECTWRKEATISKGKRAGQKIKAHCRKYTPPPQPKATKAAPAKPAEPAKPAAKATKAPAKAAEPAKPAKPAAKKAAKPPAPAN